MNSPQRAALLFLVELLASLAFPLFLDREAAKVGRLLAEDAKDVIYRSIVREWDLTAATQA